VSREFIPRNSDGSARAVADLSHFSDHYDSMMKKAETLEGFSAACYPEIICSVWILGAAITTFTSTQT
jgi:hypothetical protein